MARKPPEDIRHITCLGAGPIGAGWAAFFLARGYRVTSWLYDAGEEGKLRGLIDAAWPSLAELGLAAGASRSRLEVTDDMATAVARAEFVQESVPEDLALKQDLYARLGATVG